MFRNPRWLQPKEMGEKNIPEAAHPETRQQAFSEVTPWQSREHDWLSAGFPAYQVQLYFLKLGSMRGTFKIAISKMSFNEFLILATKPEFTDWPINILKNHTLVLCSPLMGSLYCDFFFFRNCWTKTSSEAKQSWAWLVLGWKTNSDSESHRDLWALDAY